MFTAGYNTPEAFAQQSRTILRGCDGWGCCPLQTGISVLSTCVPQQISVVQMSREAGEIQLDLKHKHASKNNLRSTHKSPIQSWSESEVDTAGHS